MSGVSKHVKPKETDYDEQTVREMFHMDGYDRYTDLERDVSRVVEDMLS